MPEPTRAIVERAFRRVDRTARFQGTVMSLIHSLAEISMANQDDLLAEIASLKQAVIDDQNGDDAIVASLNAQIEALKAGQDTSATIAALEEIRAQLRPAGQAAA